MTNENAIFFQILISTWNKIIFFAFYLALKTIQELSFLLVYFFLWTLVHLYLFLYFFIYIFLKSHFFVFFFLQIFIMFLFFYFICHYWMLCLYILLCFLNFFFVTFLQVVENVFWVDKKLRLILLVEIRRRILRTNSDSLRWRTVSFIKF